MDICFAVRWGRVYMDLDRAFDGDGWVWVADSPDAALLAATLACWPWVPMLDRG